MRPGITSSRPVAFFAALAVLVAVFMPGSAWAGGFTHPDNGPEAVGKGGAVVASVDDATAVYFNPANLALIEGLSVVIAGNFNFMSTEFQRDGLDRRFLPNEDGEIPTSEGFGAERINEPFDDVGRNCEQAALCTPVGFIAPMLFLAYGGENWGVGAGVFAPPGVGAQEYPVDGAQRYQLIRQEQSLIYFSGGGAYQFGDVRIGASIAVARLSVLFSTMVDANPSVLNPSVSRGYTGESADEYSQAFDVPLTLEATGHAPVGWLGVSWDVIPRELSLAFSAQSMTVISADGNLDIDFEGSSIPADLAQLSDDSASFETTQPFYFRLGGLWTYLLNDEPLFDVELDLMYETWSQNDVIKLAIPGGFGEPGSAEPIGNIELPKRWEDVFAVRIGSRFFALDWLEVSIGGFFETAAVPEETTSLDVFSYNRGGVSLGTNFKTPIGLDIAIGYTHFFIPERTVDNGSVRPTIGLHQCTDPYADATVCPVPGEAPGAPVNNGTYKANFDLLSVGLIYNWN